MGSKLLLDYKKPDILDRFRLHYLEGRKLNDKQETQRKQYEQAHSLRILGMSREQTVKMLLSRKIVNSQAEAYRAVSRAEQLFGDINVVHKDGLRHILTENLSRLANKAMEAGDLKNANKAYEVMAKINNLITPDTSPFDYKLLLIPVPVYTSDTKVLKAQETEDIDHEIVGDEE